MNGRRHRAGFVLLMALVLLALAGLALAGVARASLLLALEAIEAQQDLQRRWGTASCQQVLLHAEEFLPQPEGQASTPGEADPEGPLSAADGLSARAKAPIGQAPRGGRRSTADQPPGAGSINAKPSLPLPASVGWSIRLGGMTFDLVLADEDAKVNLNTVHRLRNRAEVDRIARSVSGLEADLKVHLRPEAETERPFDSWGQVFALDNGSQDGPTGESLMLATANLTCWGSGKLNLTCASDEAVEQMCRAAASGIAAPQILTARRKAPEAGVQVLYELSLRPEQRERLEEVLTDRSECHSLWVSATSEERSWHTFSVAETYPDGSTRIKSFAW